MWEIYGNESKRSKSSLGGTNALPFNYAAEPFVEFLVFNIF